MYLRTLEIKTRWKLEDKLERKLSRKSRPVNVGKHQFTLFKVMRLRDFVIHTLQVSVDFDCLQVPFDITCF